MPAFTDITGLTLTRLRDALASGETTPSEAVAASLAAIEAYEPAIKALLSVSGDKALETAKTMTAPDPAKPLWGVPVALKDNIAVKGQPCTCASKILENFVPFYDATVTGKLVDAGAIIVGKANLDEFAMGSSTENSAYQLTRNPWDPSRVPGGSSGGSGAAVAARMVPGALGTDTGGSVRLPASFCGAVGMKPTYGRVSRYGVVAYGSSLDQVGPLARTVADNALLLKVIAGHDPRDSTSMNVPVADYPALLGDGNLKGLKIGMPEEFWGEGLSDEVRERCEAAVEALKAAGAEVVRVSLPHSKYAIATYYIIAMAEVSSNLARFDGVRFGRRDPNATELVDMYKASRSAGLGDEAQRRIIIGTYVLSSGYYDAYYRKAAQVRRLVRQDFLDALTQCDVIVGPTCPVTAFPIGEMSADPLQMYLMDIFTISLNLSGLPGMSVPAGLGAASGMPVGLQMFGRAFEEATLYRTAFALEKAVGETPFPKGL